MTNPDYLEMMARARTLQSLEIHRLVRQAWNFLTNAPQKNRGFTNIPGAKTS